MLIFDSYAWFEYFIGSQRGVTVKDRLESGERIATPDIVLAEIARKYIREGATIEEVKKRLYFIVSRSEVTGIDADLALLAAETWRELRGRVRKRERSRPGLTDAIVLALGRRLGGKVVTGDEHFSGLPEAIML